MESSQANILLVDSTPDALLDVHKMLSSQNYHLSVARNGAETLQLIDTIHFDLILLSVVLPDMDGFEVLKRIRRRLVTPVIMLTVQDNEFERVFGLELGADGYLAKPFSVRELLAHIRAKVNIKHNTTRLMLRPVLEVGYLRVETQLRKTSYDQKPVALTDAEFAIIELLALNPGQIVSKNKISAQAFNRPLQVYDRSIDMHMSNLRKKFQQCHANGLIRTIRNRGYMLVQN